ncbi:MAG: hypothetical protein R3E58_01560 [Phycisphaerae bacterium]
MAAKPLPPIQIRTKRAFYDYEAKYIDDATEYNLAIDSPADLLSRIQAMSESRDRAGMQGLLPCGLMVDKITHEPYILSSTRFRDLRRIPCCQKPRAFRYGAL